MQSTFVLGVGAQKSATSWLHDYLSKAPGARMPSIKELHVWDAKFIPQCRYFLVKDSEIATSDKSSLVYAMQNFDGFYENYFKSLVAEGVSLTGDISPSYSGLRPEHYDEIRRRLQSVGLSCKAVFLIRDPVSRCWSAARMKVRRLVEEASLATFDADVVAQVFRTYFRSKGAQLRTRYDQTIKSLEASFSSDEVYIGVYEELFENDSIDAISRFFDIPPRYEAAEFIANGSPSARLPEELKLECFQFYHETYDYVWRRFPNTRVLWPDLSATA